MLVLARAVPVALRKACVRRVRHAVPAHYAQRATVIRACLPSHPERTTAEMTRPSTQQVTGTLQELLSNADLETTTETGLETALRERYATDMSEFKALIQARPDHI